MAACRASSGGASPSRRGPATSTLAPRTSLSRAAFIPLACAAFVPAAFAYGELRRITSSVWPTVVLHTVGNAIILTLLLGRLVEFKSSLAFALFTPGMEGFLSMALWALIGVGIYRKRTG